MAFKFKGKKYRFSKRIWRSRLKVISALVLSLSILGLLGIAGSMEIGSISLIRATVYIVILGVLMIISTLMINRMDD